MTTPVPTPYEMPATRDDYPVIVRWTRIILSLLLIPVSWHAFHNPYGDIPFLSGIDLAIHEFGHMLFMPFGIEFLGNTMMILGGSLIQVVFPLLFMFYFLRDRENSQRDLHAATICFWWASMNLLSVAMYCADAGPMKLMLVSGGTGQEVEGHDWNNLLRIWGVLHHYVGIARAMRGAAWLVCVVSIAAGVVVAWNSGRQRAENETSIG